MKQKNSGNSKTAKTTPAVQWNSVITVNQITEVTLAPNQYLKAINRPAECVKSAGIPGEISVGLLTVMFARQWTGITIYPALITAVCRVALKQISRFFLCQPSSAFVSPVPFFSARDTRPRYCAANPGPSIKRESHRERSPTTELKRLEVSSGSTVRLLLAGIENHDGTRLFGGAGTLTGGGGWTRLEKD